MRSSLGEDWSLALRSVRRTMRSMCNDDVLGITSSIFPSRTVEKGTSGLVSHAATSDTPKEGALHMTFFPRGASRKKKA